MKNKPVAIERLHKNDFNDVIDFMEFVFSKSSFPHDFPSILPRLYREKEELLNCIYAIKENDQIKAAAGVYPLKQKIGDMTLNHMGIGGVSTHPRSAKKGYMTAMMTKIVNDMRDNGVDHAALGGYRDRYGHFGFERAGVTYSATLSKRNMRHYFPEHNSSISFEKLTEETPEYIKSAKSLYERQICHTLRGEDFYLHTLSWKQNGYVALENDEVIGYFTSNNELSNFTEFYAEEGKYFDIVKAAAAGSDCDSLTINVPEWLMLSSAKEIFKYAENVGINGNCMWNILNFERVVKAFFSLKASYTELLDGELVVEILNEEKINIEACNNEISVERTNKSADIVLDHNSAIRLLFGILPRIDLPKLSREKELLALSYLPLPLYVLPPDQV